jgi:hypothetical protein
MAEVNDREWKRLFGAPVRRPAEGACPQGELLSSWAEGSLPADGVAHLASCPSCREDLVVLRRQQAQKGKPDRVPVDLRNRLQGLQSRPTRRILWLAAAAAALVVGVLMFFLLPSPEPTPVVRTPPMPKPAPAVPAPPMETTPPVPEAPKPERRPEPPAPGPLPEKAPPPPAPVSVPPAVATPLPTPQKAAPTIPAPEKSAAEPTRAALKGTMLAIAGSCSLQAEGEAAAQSLKPGQKREFPGMIRMKADTAAAKIAVGSVTYYVQRASELWIQLEEGRTRVQLARGEAFFDVTPGNGLFEVECSQAKVTVKGTRFLVAADKAETEVAVQRGAVDFNAAGKVVSLSPGERSTAAAGKAPAPAQKADLARRLAWVRGLEDFLWIEGEQMALQGGMAPSASRIRSSPAPKRRPRSGAGISRPFPTPSGSASPGPTTSPPRSRSRSETTCTGRRRTSPPPRAGSGCAPGRASYPTIPFASASPTRRSV